MSILNLNTDILHHLLKYLNITDTSSLICSCKRFSIVLKNPILKRKISACFKNGIMDISRAVSCHNGMIFKFILSVYRHLKIFNPKDANSEFILFEGLISAYKCERYSEASNIFNLLRMDLIDEIINEITRSDLPDKLPLFVLILSHCKLSEFNIVKMIIMGEFELIENLYDYGYIEKVVLLKTARQFLSLFTIGPITEKCKKGLRNFIKKVAALDNLSVEQFALHRESHWDLNTMEDELVAINKQTAALLWDNPASVPIAQLTVFEIPLKPVDVRVHIIECYEFEDDLKELLREALDAGASVEAIINIAVKNDSNYALATSSGSKSNYCLTYAYLIRNLSWVIDDFNLAITRLDIKDEDTLKSKIFQQTSLFCSKSELYAKQLIDFLCGLYPKQQEDIIGDLLLSILTYNLNLSILNFIELWKYPTYKSFPYLILEKLNELHVQDIMETLIQKRTFLLYIYWAWICGVHLSETTLECMRIWQNESKNKSSGFAALQDYIKYLYTLNEDTSKRKTKEDDIDNSNKRIK